jgi:two-component system LytT family response regulator
VKHSVLIVDDEPLARRGVVLRLQAHEDFEIMGECANGREARDFICERNPDLVFLDIQMPVMNGIEVMRSLDAEAQPFVIFLTAFDQYVMRAFEVHAIDYLLKPVDDARFNASLNHARRVLGSQQAAVYNQRLQSILREKPPPLGKSCASWRSAWASRCVLCRSTMSTGLKRRATTPRFMLERGPI